MEGRGLRFDFVVLWDISMCFKRLKKVYGVWMVRRLMKWA